MMMMWWSISRSLPLFDLPKLNFFYHHRIWQIAESRTVITSRHCVLHVRTYVHSHSVTPATTTTTKHKNEHRSNTGIFRFGAVYIAITPFPTIDVSPPFTETIIIICVEIKRQADDEEEFFSVDCD